jgi:hypothetical protein
VYYIVIVIELHHESPDLLACPLELHVANLHIIPQFMHGVRWLQRRNCTQTSVRTKPRFLPLFGSCQHLQTIARREDLPRAKRSRTRQSVVRKVQR